MGAPLHPRSPYASASPPSRLPRPAVGRQPTNTAPQQRQRGTAPRKSSGPLFQLLLTLQDGSTTRGGSAAAGSPDITSRPTGCALRSRPGRRGPRARRGPTPVTSAGRRSIGADGGPAPPRRQRPPPVLAVGAVAPNPYRSASGSSPDRGRLGWPAPRPRPCPGA